nr:MAG TPA: Large polyvalent protein associated domain 25 [Caudoviricetes sp.]
MNNAAESARLAREHAAELARREKAIRTRNENRAFIEQTASAQPIKDGAPVVTVEWSENGAFDDGMKFSVAAAEIIFKTLDEKNYNDQERGYDKTSFLIDYTDASGEPSTYEGRYDLGDNDGGLIAHIRSFGAFLRDKGNFGNGKPTAEDQETGAAIVALADLLDQYTEGGRVVYAMPAPWLEEYQRRKAEQAQREQEQRRQGAADILETVEMLTDEQLERAIFTISPTDKEKIDVARFFLQELSRRDEANALAVFRRWKNGDTPEQPD